MLLISRTGQKTTTTNLSQMQMFKELLQEGWTDMISFNMQFHGDLVSLMEECTEGFKIIRNTKAEVGLDAWRRFNHKYDPRNPLRNIQLLKKLLAPTQVGYADMVASIKKLEQEIPVVRHRFGDDVETSWSTSVDE